MYKKPTIPLFLRKKRLKIPKEHVEHLEKAVSDRKKPNVAVRDATQEILDLPNELKFEKVRDLKKVHPKKLDKLMKKPLYNGKKITYKKEKCSFIFPSGNRCAYWAIGNGTLCAHHGGSKYAPETRNIPSPPPMTNGHYAPAKHIPRYLIMSKEGYSDVEIAADFCVTLQTLKRWAERYPEFGEVMDVGKTLYEAWWLQKGRRNLGNRDFQVGLFKFITGQKLGYTEKIDASVKQSGNFGVLLVPQKMSVDDWENANIQESESKKALTQG
jgi:hypothetical protein